MNNEKPILSIKGEYKDTIKNLKTGEVTTKEGCNLIVDSFYTLIASLLAGKTSSGLKYWAVGSGDDTWGTPLPTPTPDDTKLLNEIGRKVITPGNIQFLDEFGVVSETPTNIIRITVTFGADECNGTWREFGIFGGNCSEAMDSGIMIDRKIHGRIDKTSEMEVTRSIKITIAGGTH